MNRRSLILSAVVMGVGVQAEEPEGQISIVLNVADPGKSVLELSDKQFPVGLGKRGTTPAGQSFQPGYSLLGEFRINAILSKTRFEMDPQLIRQSGKTEDWLRENLFSNMSSIDFDNDGKGGEYGEAFLGLEPLNSTARQPFHFGEYKGVYRWYSYAIHGTQNEERIGKCITGGCVNLGQEHLHQLLQSVKLGQTVTIQEP